MGCRSESRALDAMRDIEPSYHPFTNSSKDQHQQRLHFVRLDLTSNESVHEAAQTFTKMDMPLHILINNAGVMRNNRDVTSDGLEMTMAANVSTGDLHKYVHITLFNRSNSNSNV